MKIERLNSAIFYVSGVAFLLQSIGYLAPAWFINEIKVNHELRRFAVDGKRLVLPYWQDKSEITENMKQEMRGIVNGGSGENTPMPEPVARSNVWNKKTPSISNEQTMPTTKPKSPGRPDRSKRENNRQSEPKLTNHKSFDNDKNSQLSNIPQRLEKSGLTEPSLFGKTISIKESKSDGLKTNRKHMLYLNAGLWYARVCVNSRRMDEMTSMEGPGIEWCTMYIRTNGSALGNMKNMFELRLEASFGLGFSLLSLLAACTCCCSQRHHGKRMIVSLGSMFISGAVMAVPVVYTIIEHVKMNDMVMRHRMWKYPLINTHTKHDLFDHWSAILCGVACIISICSTLLFAILACRSNRKPSNWYKLQKGGSMISNDKHSLPTHWITGSKLTMPTDTTIVNEHQLTDEDVVDDMFTDVQEDARSSSVHDGGDSIKGGAVAEANEAFDFNEIEDQNSISSEPMS